MSYVTFVKTLDTTSYVSADTQNVFRNVNADGTTPTVPTSKLSSTNQILTSSINSAVGTNATVAKARSGFVTSITAFNSAATARYLKIYDKATAPTVGTDIPALVYVIPATSSINLDLEGQRFTNGISYALTTGALDSDTGAIGANEIKVSINYR
jgi:hypothetical protein